MSRLFLLGCVVMKIEMSFGKLVNNIVILVKLRRWKLN